MVQTNLLILVRKTGHQMDNFYEMFKHNIEVPIKEIKVPVAPASYNDIVKREINAINQTMEEINEKRLFEYSYIQKHSRSLKSIKRSPDLQILSTTNHFVLKLARDNQNG